MINVEIFGVIIALMLFALFLFSIRNSIIIIFKWNRIVNFSEFDNEYKSEHFYLLLFSNYLGTFLRFYTLGDFDFITDEYYILVLQ